MIFQYPHPWPRNSRRFIQFFDVAVDWGLDTHKQSTI
jgi:hypothetical protein